MQRLYAITTLWCRWCKIGLHLSKLAAWDEVQHKQVYQVSWRRGNYWANGVCTGCQRSWSCIAPDWQSCLSSHSAAFKRNIETFTFPHSLLYVVWRMGIFQTFYLWLVSSPWVYADCLRRESNFLDSTSRVTALCMCVLLHCMRVGLHNGYTQAYAQMMQHTHTHKAVTGCLEANKWLSHRRQSNYRHKFCFSKFTWTKMKIHHPFLRSVLHVQKQNRNVQKHF